MYLLNQKKLQSFTVGYIGGVLSMIGIFLATMDIHFNKFDFEYFSYALVRILLIAVASGVLSTVLHKRSNLLKFFIGAIVGSIIAYVAIKF